jgi:hypothetical protein
MQNNITQNTKSDGRQSPPLGDLGGLRSEKVRNIIGQIPPTLLQYGIGTIGLSLLLLVVIAAFIPHQPSFDTEITVTQGENGRLHFTAYIPQRAMKAQRRMADMTINNELDFPLPSRFLIKEISETVYLSEAAAWYVAELVPAEDFSQQVKLTENITLAGKIRLERRSLLVWGVRRVVGESFFRE